jgi:hypothetical protein
MAVWDDLNDLTVEVYAEGITPISDAEGELRFVEQVELAKGYPGGLYLDASFRVARDVLKKWAAEGGKRALIRNKLTPVWEGRLGNLERVLEGDAGQYVHVTGKGFWGAYLMRRRLRKRWADARIEDDIWVWGEGYLAAAIAEYDRHGRLRITPKNEAWGSGDYAGFEYTMPTGQTIKKITYDYNQAGGDFKLIFYDPSATNGDHVIVNGGGSGTGGSYTLTTPVQRMQLRFVATAANTPANDGSVYGEIFNVRVYSETSAINMEEIFKNVAGMVTSLSSDTRLIQAAGTALALDPYVADDWPATADVLEEAASFGDGDGNTWGFGVRCSELAGTPDGKPLLFLEQRPALTDYDYVVRAGDENVMGPVQLYQEDSEEVFNWIIAQRRDERGRVQFTTPDDDATLKDTDSIAAYDEQDYVFDAGSVSEAAAIARGVRFLAMRKDALWKLRSPLRVRGYIRHKLSGLMIPASEIEPGMRVKFEDFVDEDVVLLISMTRYAHDGQVCTITAGPLEDGVRAFAPNVPVYEADEEDERGTRGGTRPEVRHIYEHLGMTRADWIKLTAAEKLAKKRIWWNRRRERRGSLM